MAYTEIESDLLNNKGIGTMELKKDERFLWLLGLC